MKTILVVDDEIILREYLTELLELEDFKPIGVSSGTEALAQINRQKPDMIICDMFLREETGLDLLHKISTTSAATTPFVLMSAEINSELMEKSAAKGVKAFIKKPYESDVLLNTIRKLL
jgi:DNA-binding NtrC family response regulator